ncbi:MAG: polyprenyl diphosphate synthase [bacterium]|nr:polyprenyl diphosphate synthase [bacterium]
MTKKSLVKITLPEGTKIPNHIAMILDGNRRWARARGKEPWVGHKAGYEAVNRLAKAARELGVHTFTVWAFSTENWDRPQSELNEIFNVFRLALSQAEKDVPKEKVRFIQLGRRDRLPADIRDRLAKLEAISKDFAANVFNVALDYGGQDEIVRAAREIVKEKIPAEQIDTKVFAAHLDTASQPYPYVDLFIRTSGEQRTSGLMPWQMAYAELFWEQDHLPDFTPEKLKNAILDYSRRRRRFGGNDIEKHLRFNPKVVADLELKWRHALQAKEGERLRDLAVRYVKEHYGLSKELAKEAGLSLAKALVFRQKQDWSRAKASLEDLYGILQKTLKLAFEPQIIAKIEVDLWREGESEESLRNLLAEKFRFSTFQAAKSAHLAYLADRAADDKNWTKARDYLVKFYTALKERVA